MAAGSQPGPRAHGACGVIYIPAWLCLESSSSLLFLELQEQMEGAGSMAELYCSELPAQGTSSCCPPAPSCPQSGLKQEGWGAETTA